MTVPKSCPIGFATNNLSAIVTRLFDNLPDHIVIGTESEIMYSSLPEFDLYTDPKDPAFARAYEMNKIIPGGHQHTITDGHVMLVKPKTPHPQLSCGYKMHGMAYTIEDSNSHHRLRDVNRKLTEKGFVPVYANLLFMAGEAIHARVQTEQIRERSDCTTIVQVESTDHIFYRCMFDY